MIECVTLTNAQSTNNVGRLGSGCGAVGRAVAWDTRGLRFESSHLLTFILNICILSTVLKRRKYIKEDREWSIKNNVGRHIDFTQDRHG